MASSARCVVVLLAVFVCYSSVSTWGMLLQTHQSPVVQQVKKVRQQPQTRPLTYDQQAKKLKNQPQWSPQQVTQRPDATTPIEKCQVKEEERLTCGVPDLTLAQCEAINCCFDEWRCYYGKAGDCFGFSLLFYNLHVLCICPCLAC